MTELQNEQNIQTSNSAPIKENKNDNVSLYFSIIGIIWFIVGIFSIRFGGPTLAGTTLLLAGIFLGPCFIIISFILGIIRLFRKSGKISIISIIVFLFFLYLCFNSGILLVIILLNNF